MPGCSPVDWPEDASPRLLANNKETHTMPVFTAIPQSLVAQNPSLITDALLPATPGLTFDTSSLSVISGPQSLSFYDGSLTPLGIGAGLLLTTGKIGRAHV